MCIGRQQFLEKDRSRGPSVENAGSYLMFIFDGVPKKIIRGHIQNRILWIHDPKRF